MSKYACQIFHSWNVNHGQEGNVKLQKQNEIHFLLGGSTPCASLTFMYATAAALSSQQVDLVVSLISAGGQSGSPTNLERRRPSGTPAETRYRILHRKMTQDFPQPDIVYAVNTVQEMGRKHFSHLQHLGRHPPVQRHKIV